MEVDLQEMARSLPPEAAPILLENGYFEPDRLDPGSAAPRLALSARAGGDSVTIGGDRDRPMVLIFGSYT
jgi:hypothetical protein